MIVIYGIKEQLNPVKAQLSNVIHSCMQSVLGMPKINVLIALFRWIKKIFIILVIAVMLIL